LKIFITGVTGFVGGALANHFIKMGHTVTGTGRSAQLPPHVNIACRYLQQDITKTILPIEADIVIHSAAITSDIASYDEVYSANTIGTIHVINACIKVKKFILVSTSSVYAFNENKAYKEADAGNDVELLSPYGKTKFLAEKELLLTNKFEQKFILRPRAIYGVGDTALLPRLFKFVKQHKLYLPAAITKQISLTHIDSFVDAITHCVQDATTKIETYNIADEQPYCLKTCIQQLTEATIQQKLKVVLIPSIIWNALVLCNTVFKFIPELTKFGSKQLTNMAVLDISHAIKNLHYKPTNNFKEISKQVGLWYNSK
jgi:nucleoside-diphosphate-sugar epimerase